MSVIFVLAEHRKGNLLDINWELLHKGASLKAAGNEIVAVLLGYNTEKMAIQLTAKADRVLVADDKLLENYNYETYRDVLTQLIQSEKPVLTVLGQTTFGMDLAAGLATSLNLPLATACIDFQLKDGGVAVTRQMYDGKVNAEITVAGENGCMITVRPGSFPGEGQATVNGQIQKASISVKEPEKLKFVEFVEAALGGVDITQADVLVSVGQGIGDKKNIPIVEELAALMGASLSCSRPVVDKKWLPKERQVGSSGKTVKPKIYLAIGISGSFQHLMGLKGGTIIAINKDPKAPIFRVADYGIVGDLFQVVPVLKEKVKALKAG